MKGPMLLTFNPGSSTIKFGVFRMTCNSPVRIGSGSIDFRHVPMELAISTGGKAFKVPLHACLTGDLHDVIDETLDRFKTYFSLNDLTAVGHRVVHGGDRFKGPVAIDNRILSAIEDLVPLAPLHQPQSVRLIRAIQTLRPHVRQSASFDTAFHQDQPELVRRFAIPRHLFDEGIKRYGFHGLSYQFIATQLASEFPALARGKVVIAHLGSGASLCALDAGVSRDTSMGFSTLDGIPMATRCGALDVGVVLHLLGQRHCSLAEVQALLYHQSGLLGVSGLSADTRELLASELPQARQALELFTFRIAGEVARLATSLGGLDALVFTAGIGEHQPAIRSAVCERLAWLGVRIDTRSNASNARMISCAESKPVVCVIATDEEQVIAQETVSVLHA